MYLGIFDTMCENMKRADARIFSFLSFSGVTLPLPTTLVGQRCHWRRYNQYHRHPRLSWSVYFHNLKCSNYKHHPSYPVLCKCSLPPARQKNMKSINFDYFCIKPHLIFVQMSNYILWERPCYILKVCWGWIYNIFWTKQNDQLLLFMMKIIFCLSFSECCTF